MQSFMEDLKSIREAMAHELKELAERCESPYGKNKFQDQAYLVQKVFQRIEDAALKFQQVW